MRHTLPLIVALLAGFAARAEPARLVVRTQADLPRQTFAATGQADSLVIDPQRRAAFAAEVRDGVRHLLETTTIQDRATLRELHKALLDAALASGDTAAARTELTIFLGLQDKQADRLFVGLLPTAWLDSLAAGPAGSPPQKAAFKTRYAALLAPVPWGVVAENAHARAMSLKLISPALLQGAAAADAQSAMDKTGALDRTAAETVIRYAAAAVTQLPMKAAAVADLSAYIKLHDQPKPDIWQARAAVMPAGVKLTPVVIAIWDSGVDMAVYHGQLWGASKAMIAAGDTPNGIAFDVEYRPSRSQMKDVDPEFVGRLDEARGLSSGLSDLQSGVSSPAADAAQQRLASFDPGQMKSFMALESFYGEYGHGTHVAGIASAGNPAARLLDARIEFDERQVPALPTMERAHRAAEAYGQTVALFRKAHVRVVNMSWGLSQQDDFERVLQAAGVAEPQRSREAREQYAVAAAGLRAAIASAPDILFVCAAGNSNDDNTFNQFVPSSFDLPNLLTVGAVDQAGEPTSFTTSGKNVAVYASGYQVASHVPGGSIQAWSGTSMASPQVTNLAGKIFALHPEMTAMQVKADILAHAAAEQKGGPVLLNPRATISAAF